MKLRRHISLLLFSALLFIGCSSFSGSREDIPPSTLSELKIIYENNTYSEVTREKSAISYNFDIGYFEILWQKTVVQKDKDGNTISYLIPILPTKSKICLRNNDRQLVTSYFLQIIGQVCFIKIDILPGFSLYTFLNGDVHKIQIESNSKLCCTTYYSSNNISDGHISDLFEYIMSGLEIYSQKESKAGNDTLEASIITAPYPEWWQQYFYSLFNYQLLMMGGVSDTIAVSDSLIDDPMAGGGGFGASGSTPPSGTNLYGTNLGPANLENYIGTDSYYLQRYNDYIRRHDDDPSIYYISYGQKYYERFMNLYQSNVLSSQGQTWITNAAYLLQRKLENIIAYYPDIESNPDQLKQMAFATHPEAYCDAGFMALPMSDKLQVAFSIDLSDLISLDGIAQVMVISFMQINYYTNHLSCALSDAFYIRNNWRDILNDIASYFGITKSVANEELDNAVSFLLGAQIQYFYENIPGFELPDL